MSTDEHDKEPGSDKSGVDVLIVKTLSILFVLGIYMIIFLKILFLN